MEYYKNILILFFLFIVFNIHGQQILVTNLINNPSFEEHDTCPYNVAQLYLSKYWWGYSTEYYNTCDSTAPFYFSVPSNWAGFQYPHSGNAYAGLIIYSNNCMPTALDYRETIKTKLNDTLISKKRYCANLYLSLANGYIGPNLYLLLDSIGMLFTKDSVPDIDSVFFYNGIKVQNTITNLDTLNWLKISNSFIASGGEQYLTIGNFDNVIHYPAGVFFEVYVYVDDVKVCECSFNFNLGNDTTLCLGQSLTLNPNMPNAIYTWQDGSTDSIYKVTHTGTYWVSAYFADYNITTTDTIKITYINCDTVQPIIPDIYIPNSFTPNGDGKNDMFNIKTVYEFSDYKLVIYNRWGELLFDSDDKNKGWDGTFKGKPVPLGVYVYQLTAIIKDTGEQRKITGRVTVVR